MIEERLASMRGSRNFRQGGGGASRSTDNAFFSPQLILLKSNGEFRRKLSFSMFQRGFNFFQGGPIAYSL